MRWGLLSTANINRKLLAGAAGTDEATVAAVASRDRSRAEAFAREHGIERALGSYEALLEDPEIDAVYNPLPNSMHVPWTVRALEAGKHVLCEKPLSRHPDEVEAAFAAARQQGRHAGGGVHVAPPPADARAARAARRGRRRAAADGHARRSRSRWLT